MHRNERGPIIRHLASDTMGKRTRAIGPQGKSTRGRIESEPLHSEFFTPSCFEETKLT